MTRHTPPSERPRNPLSGDAELFDASVGHMTGPSSTHTLLGCPAEAAVDASGTARSAPLSSGSTHAATRDADLEALWSVVAPVRSHYVTLPCVNPDLAAVTGAVDIHASADAGSVVPEGPGTGRGPHRGGRGGSEGRHAAAPSGGGAAGGCSVCGGRQGHPPPRRRTGHPCRLGDVPADPPAVSVAKRLLMVGSLPLPGEAWEEPPFRAACSAPLVCDPVHTETPPHACPCRRRIGFGTAATGSVTGRSSTRDPRDRRGSRGWRSLPGDTARPLSGGDVFHDPSSGVGIHDPAHVAVAVPPAARELCSVFPLVDGPIPCGLRGGGTGMSFSREPVWGCVGSSTSVSSAPSVAARVSAQRAFATATKATGFDAVDVYLESGADELTSPTRGFVSAASTGGGSAAPSEPLLEPTGRSSSPQPSCESALETHPTPEDGDVRLSPRDRVDVGTEDSPAVAGAVCLGPISLGTFSHETPSSGHAPTSPSTLADGVTDALYGRVSLGAADSSTRCAGVGPMIRGRVPGWSASALPLVSPVLSMPPRTPPVPVQCPVPAVGHRRHLSARGLSLPAGTLSDVSESSPNDGCSRRLALSRPAHPAMAPTGADSPSQRERGAAGNGLCSTHRAGPSSASSEVHLPSSRELQGNSIADASPSPPSSGSTPPSQEQLPVSAFVRLRARLSAGWDTAGVLSPLSVPSPLSGLQSMSDEFHVRPAQVSLGTEAVPVEAQSESAADGVLNNANRAAVSEFSRGQSSDGVSENVVDVSPNLGRPLYGGSSAPVKVPSGDCLTPLSLPVSRMALSPQSTSDLSSPPAGSSAGTTQLRRQALVSRVASCSQTTLVDEDTERRRKARRATVTGLASVVIVPVDTATGSLKSSHTFRASEALDQGQMVRSAAVAAAARAGDGSVSAKSGGSTNDTDIAVVGYSQAVPVLDNRPAMAPARIVVGAQRATRASIRAAALGDI
eukprot:TRINITY_DN1398_c0_g1_i1.p1 TRINITY_DN1398_c0_g1~~TRINITY_DN1398_c0_g1_i1.p1  ORF type:complete len:960 (+),score=91.52 TRINITY_DN1398_c0_g1_i1:1872-4751(+)